MKSKVIIHPNRIEIQNYDMFENTDSLVKLTSVFDHIYHNLKNTLMVYEDNNTVIIPRYFSKNKLAPVIEKCDIEYNNDFMPHVVGIDYKWKHNIKPRDDEQWRITNFLRKAKYNNNVLNLHTGAGKTFLSLYYAKYLGVKSVIIVDSQKLVDQWLRDIKTYTNLKYDQCVYIKQKKGVQKVIDDDQTNVVLYILQHATIRNVMKKDRNIAIKLFNKMGVGLKIIDEAHTNYINTFKIDSLVDIKYNLYLTATISRSDYIEAYMLKNVLPRSTFIDKENTINKNIVFYLGVYNTYPDEYIDKKISDGKKYGFDLNGWSNYIYSDINNWETYLTTIEKMLKMIIKKTNRKIAIAIPRINMINDTLEYLKSLEVFKHKTFTCLHSKCKHMDITGSDIIIGTNKILGKGMDIENLGAMLNMGPYTSDPNIANQISGRLRPLPNGELSYYIEMVDIGFSKSLKQRKARLKGFKDKAVKIIVATEPLSDTKLTKCDIDNCQGYDSKKDKLYRINSEVDNVLKSVIGDNARNICSVCFDKLVRDDVVLDSLVQIEKDVVKLRN